MTEPICCKCKTPMKRGIALQNTPKMGVPDLPGNTVDSRGQTVTLTGLARLVDVPKCPECGGYDAKQFLADVRRAS